MGTNLEQQFNKVLAMVSPSEKSTNKELAQQTSRLVRALQLLRSILEPQKMLATGQV